jgi:hypothetical protein
VSVVCCQVEVSATGWSLVQRSPTEYGVSECNREASTMRRPRPPRGCCAIGKKYITLTLNSFKQWNRAFNCWHKLYGSCTLYIDGWDIRANNSVRYTMLLDILLYRGTKEWGPRLSSTRNWIFSCRPDCERGVGQRGSAVSPSARDVTQTSDNTVSLQLLPVW